MDRSSDQDLSADAPLHLVFMGVSGSGKTSAAVAVRDLLGWDFAEGDDFHPPDNVAAMVSGRALTDSDRWGWLERLAAWTRQHDAARRPTVVSCSALRRSYRDVLRGGGERTFFVHLTGEPTLLRQRMGQRIHFMPPELLESQLATLEPLQEDEEGMSVDMTLPLDRIAAMVLDRLDLFTRPR